MNIYSFIRKFGAETGLFCLCLFLFFFRLGNIPLIDYDEALYVSCAKQMVVTNNWVVSRLNTRMPERPGATQIAFFEKPIMVYWVSAASMRLFGTNMWAARLPVALVALITTFTITLTGRRWFGRRAGLLAGLVYATAPITLVDARQMTTDGLLVLTLTLTLLSFWELERSSKKAAWLFWVVSALAVLTKGIVGMLLPFMIIVIYVLIDRLLFRVRFRPPYGPRLRFALQLRPLRALWSSLSRLRPVSGLLLFLLIAAPWHLLILHSGDLDAQGRTWVQEYLLRQHVGRFRGLDAVHNQPLPTYIVYFLLGFFPWACFVPTAFRQVAKEEKKVSPISFLLVWFWTIFIFFSLSSAKLPTYIAPAYPAAALLLGRWLDGILPIGRRRKSGLEAATPGGTTTHGAAQTKQEETKQEETKQEETKQEETKQEEAKQEEAKQEEAKQEETKQEEAKQEEAKQEETKQEEGTFGRLRVSDEVWQRAGATLRRGAATACGVGLILFVAALFTPSRTSTNVLLPVALIRFATHLALLFAVGSGAAWICFSMRREDGRERIWGVAALTTMMFLVIALASTEGYSAVHDEVFDPYQSLARDARPDERAGIPVVYYHVVPRRPSMLFYAEYAPFEHKETPLLPFLATCLTKPQREADIICTGQSYDILVKEIAAVKGATIRSMERRGPVDGWVLSRVYLPATYVPPPVQKPREGLWTPVSY